VEHISSFSYKFADHLCKFFVQIFRLPLKFFVQQWKRTLYKSLALATTLSALCNMLMLLWLLRRKIGFFGGNRILITAVKSTAASIPMAAAVWYSCSLVDWSQTGHKLLKGSVLGGSIVCGSALYVLTVKLLRSEEAIDALSLLRRKLKRG